jgi:hypothetical protein
VVCREDFTRNSSAKRHKGIVHQGNCLIVRHIEYVAGRASGLYPEPRTPPRMSRKRKIINFSRGIMITIYSCSTLLLFFQFLIVLQTRFGVEMLQKVSYIANLKLMDGIIIFIIILKVKQIL